MQKSFKMIAVDCFILLVLVLLLYTVWGGSIRMSQANNFFKAGAYDSAQNIYEDLAVDLPASPNVRHNLGLCLYQEGLYERAVKALRGCIPKKTLSNPGRVQTLAHADIYYYHLGNAYYKSAARNNIDTASAVKLYTAALDNYKNALIVNPADSQSKYNYELTLVHLKQLANQPPPQQQEIENLLQNTQNSDQYKVKFTNDNDTPPNGKDW